jgi:hypothetical protein
MHGNNLKEQLVKTPTSSLKRKITDSKAKENPVWSPNGQSFEATCKLPVD